MNQIALWRCRSLCNLGCIKHSINSFFVCVNIHNFDWRWLDCFKFCFWSPHRLPSVCMWWDCLRQNMHSDTYFSPLEWNSIDAISGSDDFGWCSFHFVFWCGAMWRKDNGTNMNHGMIFHTAADNCHSNRFDRCQKPNHKFISIWFCCEHCSNINWIINNRCKSHMWYTIILLLIYWYILSRVRHF